jgi:putative membrane protein
MNNEFSQLQRQSFNGIFLIFFADMAKQFKRYFYALFAPFLSESFRNNYLEYLIAGIVVLIIAQFVFSYLSYLKYQFQVQKNAFIVQKGVIKRSVVEIPFHRIQNINIQQNILQQIFGVVGFQIETAGESASEIKIKALDSFTAQSLKEVLLEELNEAENKNFKSSIDSDENYQVLDTKHHEEVQKTSATQKPSVLLHLSFGRLIKVGLSANYFKGFGLLAVFLSTLSNFIFDVLAKFVDIDFDEDLVNRLPETLSFILLLTFIFILLIFLVTVSLEVIKYFNLKVIRVKDNFEVAYGLFKRINQIIKKNKTQVVSIENNPLLRFFKINNVFVSQASATTITEKQKIGLVGISYQQFEEFFLAIFDVPYGQDFVITNTSYRFMVVLFWRQILIYIGFGVAGYFFLPTMATFVLIAIVLLGFTFLNYKIVAKSFLGINHDLIKVGSGAISTKSEYIALHKIQSVQLKRSIFQRYNGHATLVLYTASGSISIPYLPYNEALSHFNYILYKVESSNLSWI